MFYDGNTWKFGLVSIEEENASSNCQKWMANLLFEKVVDFETHLCNTRLDWIELTVE
jgi:hypothetical protein